MLLGQALARLSTDIPIIRGEQAGGIEPDGRWRVSIDRAANTGTILESASDLIGI